MVIGGGAIVLIAVIIVVIVLSKRDKLPGVPVIVVIGGGSALTGRVGRHSTAGLAVVSAARLVLAHLEKGVGRCHPDLGHEGRIVGGPVGKEGRRAWS